MNEIKYFNAPKLDPRSLRSFLTVAAYGSLSKASEHLDIAQPALTRQIHRLEEALSVKLFERHSHGMAITVAGEALREHAIKILQQLEDAEIDVASRSGRMVGRVVLGLPPTLGLVLSSSLIERYHNKFPDVRLEVIEEMSGFLVEQLDSGKIDLAVLYTPKIKSRMKIMPLIMEQLFLIGPANAELGSQSQIEMADLGQFKYILPGPDHGLRKLVEQRFADHDIALQVVMDVHAFRLQKELVVRGLGYSILPMASIHQELEDHTLKAFPIVNPRLERELVIACPADRPLSAASQAMQTLLRDAVESWVKSDMLVGKLLD